MTTTNIYSGAVEGKPTSRVLQPPGGGSSNIFGASEPASAQPRTVKQYNRTDPGNLFGSADPTPAQQPAKSNDRMASNVFGEATKQAPPPDQKEPEQEDEDKKDDDEVEKTEEKVEENEEKPNEERNNNSNAQPAQPYRRDAGADKSNSNATGNPLTGHGYTAPTESPQVHTSTRVRQPPGGASSKLW